VNENHAILCASLEWAEHLESEVLAPLVAAVDLGDEMLELGPGPGAATRWLRHRVKRLVALELDATAAARLADELAGSNVTVEVGDCTCAPYPDASFDAVGAFTMLHHLPTQALPRSGTPARVRASGRVRPSDADGRPVAALHRPQTT